MNREPTNVRQDIFNGSNFWRHGRPNGQAGAAVRNSCVWRRNEPPRRAEQRNRDNHGHGPDDTDDSAPSPRCAFFPSPSLT
jgi:hypothetical protein